MEGAAERVAAIKAIWTQEEPTYHGQFVNFDPIWSYPKPVQRPHPPVLLGAHGTQALRRVVDYCDGWIPFTPGIKDLRAEIGELRRLAREAGRDPRSLSVNVYFTPPERAAVEQYRDAGADRVIFRLPPAGAPSVLRALDEYARLIS
jgi:alkanesulfonate monooxygenase SsuD/methylene tetrahydromethanopterin reductase-like flavin-dependent oxidoreductase (luciferase family)